MWRLLEFTNDGMQYLFVFNFKNFILFLTRYEYKNRIFKKSVYIQTGCHTKITHLYHHTLVYLIITLLIYNIIL